MTTERFKMIINRKRDLFYSYNFTLLLIPDHLIIKKGFIGLLQFPNKNLYLSEMVAILLL